MKKTLQELTIIDDFLFGVVMSDSENCRLLLEIILDMEIEHVEVITEKQLRYHPEFKGVRLDVYAKDEHNTHFNVEMQVRRTPILKRSRYYHAQIDMDLLSKGSDHEELPDNYVIFICDYDPFGQGKYRYHIHSKCDECPDLNTNDGLHTIILNNKGRNPDEVPEELVRFLKYTNEKLEDSEKESEDIFIRRVQQTIQLIKSSREMEARYMSFLDIIEDKVKEATEIAIAEGRLKGIEEGRAEGRLKGIEEGRLKGIEEGRLKGIEEGRAEGRISSILDILSTHGTIPQSVKDTLLTIQDFDLLKKITLIAAQAKTMKEFEAKLHELIR